MPLAKDTLLGEWLREFQAGSGHFNSSALFLEVQLRKALAATSSAQPDAFRTAAVCECLSRLPETAGSYSRILQLIRAELLRSIYEDFDAIEERGAPVDAKVRPAPPPHRTPFARRRERPASLRMA